MISLFLAGDVMTGRGIDQVLPHPGDPRLHESYVKSACDYVELSERTNGPIARPVAFADIWGDALAELERRRPDARIVNLEIAVTQSTEPEPKGINYKMNPANVGAITAAGIDCSVLANNHVLDWGPAGLIDMVPLRIRNMRLHDASPADVGWLADTLNREGKRFGTRIRIGPDRVLKAELDARHETP